MTAFETARIDCRLLGRPLDAETADQLLREIEALRKEVEQSDALANGRQEFLANLIGAGRNLLLGTSDIWLDSKLDIAPAEWERAVEPLLAAFRQALEVADQYQ